MGNQCQKDARKKMALKTSRIVEKQGPVTLEEFLAQGHKRSRQQRKSEVDSTNRHCDSLPASAILA